MKSEGKPLISDRGKIHVTNDGHSCPVMMTITEILLLRRINIFDMSLQRDLLKIKTDVHMEERP